MLAMIAGDRNELVRLPLRLYRSEIAATNSVRVPMLTRLAIGYLVDVEPVHTLRLSSPAATVPTNPNYFQPADEANAAAGPCLRAARREPGAVANTPPGQTRFTHADQALALL
jgi:hypothetical protein